MPRKIGPQFTVGPDVDIEIFYCDSVDDRALLRVHYRIEHLPSRPGQYVLRHYVAASEDDRRRAVDVVAGMDLDDAFRYWTAHGVAHRFRWPHDRRRWVEIVDMGTRVDDPLVQLELEMMIDLHSGVTV